MKLKIQYCSDLHLEFPENKKFLMANPLAIKGDILLLAGDVVPFAVMDKQDDFFNWAADNFEATYLIPGNHEYYYADITTDSGAVHEKIRSNVFLINNQVFKHNNVRLIFSTLWSKISPVNYWTIQQNISDFQVIKFAGEKFTPQHFNQLHQDCVDFLTTTFQKKHDGKTVVVSHHVPTFLNYPEKYKNSEVNEVFGVELYDFIENSQPDFWIYGHHHQNVPDFEIGPTRLITNQLGYVKYKENTRFSNEKIINL